MENDFFAIATGRRGRGKSFNCAMLIAEYLANGAVVVTNLPLFNVELKKYLEVRYGWKLQPGQLVEVSPHHTALYSNSDDKIQQRKDYLYELRHMFRHCPPGKDLHHPNLIVWDETRSFADAKQAVKNVENNEDIRTFLQLGRHFHINSVFIIQSHKMLESAIKDMATEVWAFFDFSKLEIPMFPINGPQIFLQLRFEEDGKTPLQPARRWVRKDPAVYKIYDSHDRPPDVEVAEGQSHFEADTATRKKYRRKQMLRYAGFFIIGFFLWAIFGRSEKSSGIIPGSVLSAPSSSQRKAPQPVQSTPAPAAVARSAPAPQTPGVEYARIVSLVQAGDGPWVARTADGREFREGDRMGSIRVAAVDRNMRFVLLDVSGTPYYIVNATENPPPGAMPFQGRPEPAPYQPPKLAPATIPQPPAAFAGR